MKRLINSLLLAMVVYFLFSLITSTMAFYRPNRARAEGTPSQVIAPKSGAGDGIALIETRMDAWNARIALLREAERTLDIVYHSVHADCCGHAFWGEIVRAADRGVRVRVLLDGKVGAASRHTKAILHALNRHPYIECKRYNPLHILRPSRWHALLHDKFILMDGRHVLLGGRNVGDRYFGPPGYNGVLVEDRDVLVAGSGMSDGVLHDVQAYMERLWTSPDAVCCKRARKTEQTAYAALCEKADQLQARSPGWYTVSLSEYKARMVHANAITLLCNPIHTVQKEPLIGKALQSLAQEATRSVLIQTPYMTGNPAFLSAIGQACGRAAVSIQTNSMRSTPNCIAFSNYYFHRSAFLDVGATVHEYHGDGSIHGKSFVFDGQISAVGSLNLDDRSMYIDTESMLLIDSPAFSRELSDAIERLTDQSVTINKSSMAVVSDPAREEQVRTGKRLLIQLASVVTRPFKFLL